MPVCKAGVALCDIPTGCIACQKSFCVTGAILLRRFQKMTFIYSGRRSTLDVSIFILGGRRSTLDVSCGVVCFCKSHCQGCVKLLTTCTSRGRRGTSRACHFNPMFGADPFCVECGFARQAPYLRHSTLDTPHSALYSSHSPLATPDPIYTLRSTLYT